MTCLDILLISDGRPGHYRLSEGICAAIARRRPIAVTRIVVRRPWWVPNGGLAALPATASIMPMALGFSARQPRCDFVVSAGGNTLAANRWLAQRWGCPNIFYGSLRRYEPRDFSLVLSSYDRPNAPPNEVMTLKPSAYDPDGGELGAQGTAGTKGVGLLVGGDSGTMRYRPADWAQLLALVRAPPHPGRAWHVTNSRRTPAAVSDALARSAAQRDGSIASFIDVRRPDALSVGELLAVVDAVAVTVDSSSMMSEAIWARKPVAALLPHGALLPPAEQRYRDGLAGRGLVASLTLAEATPINLAAAFATVRPLQANPLDELASLIATRLPQLKL